MNDTGPTVVDTSVAVKWFFEEPHSGQALRLKEMFRQGTRYPIAPDLIYAEFTNAVWKRVAFEGFDPGTGEDIIRIFVSIPFKIIPSLTLLSVGYHLSIDLSQSIYDVLFLSLSIAMDADLVTADEKFYRKTRSRFPNIHWLGTWP